MVNRFVYYFGNGHADGGQADRALLGSKGANLAEMTYLGLPVPPGFVVTTDACRSFRETGTLPDGLVAEVTHALHGLERRMAQRLGDPDAPLLLSVRSGAPSRAAGLHAGTAEGISPGGASAQRACRRCTTPDCRPHPRCRSASLTTGGLRPPESRSTAPARARSTWASEPRRRVSAPRRRPPGRASASPGPCRNSGPDGSVDARRRSTATDPAAAERADLLQRLHKARFDLVERWT